MLTFLLSLIFFRRLYLFLEHRGVVPRGCVTLLAYYEFILLNGKPLKSH